MSADPDMTPSFQAKQKYCIFPHCWYHLFAARCYRSADSKTVNQNQLEQLVVKRKRSHKNSALTRCKAIRPTQAHGLIGLAQSVLTSPAAKNAYIHSVEFHNDPTYRIWIFKKKLDFNRQTKKKPSHYRCTSCINSSPCTLVVFSKYIT